MVEGEPSSKSIAFKAKTQSKAKHKKIKIESSSCDEEEEDDDEASEEDEGELALLMRKFTHLDNKINKRGYNYDPKKNAFRPRGMTSSKCATIVMKKATSPPIDLCRTRGSSRASPSIAKIQAMKKMKSPSASL